MPVALDKQEIWRYDETPVFYDDNMLAFYPFKNPLVREIETGNYEAHYRIIDETGKERNVVFADYIDTQEEAESRLQYTGGPFSYSYYDVTTNTDKAIVKLHKDHEGNLYRASIYGRPIILDLSRSYFIRDQKAINQYGTVALNVTGSYFSEYEVDGISGTLAHYEDWVVRELAERIQNKNEIIVKTHKALFNARVGAKVKVTVNNEQIIGTINAFSFRYRKDRAFVASFKISG